jgi:hypothetical protein
MLSIIQVIIGLMICISWFLKFRGERAEIILYPELSQSKIPANLWHQPSSHFCFWKKTKGGKEDGGSDET